MEIAAKRTIKDIEDEYLAKISKVRETIEAFDSMVESVRSMCSVGHASEGWPGGSSPRLYEREMLAALNKSAWRATYDLCRIDMIAPVADRDRFKAEFERAPEFSLANAAATFGDYVSNQRFYVLKGLVLQFCKLDPYFKSHSKVKAGVKGLPKRFIITSFSGWHNRYGVEQVRDILNAIAVYRGLPMLQYHEVSALSKTGGELASHGVKIKTFANGNAHLYFDQDTLEAVNLAIAEFYGDVLPDAWTPKPSRQRQSRALAKDLQFYWTPKEVAHELVRFSGVRHGDKVLEPSCGEGHLMEEIARVTPNVFGVEVCEERVAKCRSKGFAVLADNFLESSLEGDYDAVIMNPPFYGTHYALHVEHAMQFLKPGGVLTAILPATARYDHGLLEGDWRDLPAASFRAAGTNVPTVMLRKIKR